MKQLLYIILVFIFCSCNKDIALNVDPVTENAPDYNLLAESSSLFLYDKISNKYSVSPNIYLRPFDHVSNLDQVTVKFNSNHFARYVINSDTLYNNDKKNVSYSDFSKYLIIFNYQSEIKGTHNITIETTIRSVTKTTSLTLTTKD